MSKSLKFSTLAVVVFVASAAVAEEKIGLGRIATSDEVAAWNKDVRPDGQGLPIGQGGVLEGEELFAESCAMCHGDFGEGVDRWPVLAGGQDSLTDDRPVKTVGSYWPYLSTVFDYVNRAMPFGNPQSLEPDEVFAITAYILYSNDIVDEDFVLSNDNFTQIRMPNEFNIYTDDRPEIELPRFSGEACMTDCKTIVEITARAAVVDVTPEDEQAGTEDVTNAEPVEIAQALDSEEVAAGEKLFKKCKACHQIGEGARNKTGPMLNGIVGRPAGTVESFRYSKSMVSAGEDGMMWDDATLAGFLTKPRSFIKGTKMSFSGFKKEADIQSMITYLKTFNE